MTACFTSSPRYVSAAFLSFPRIIAETCCGVYSFPPAWTRASWFCPLMILYGTSRTSSLTSSYRRPMNRLMEKTVFSGFRTAWRFATWPTRIWPSLPNPTTDGVSRPPSSLMSTFGSLPSITATTEFVVPRSIPMIFAIVVAPSPYLFWSSVFRRHGPSSLVA